MKSAEDEALFLAEIEKALVAGVAVHGKDSESSTVAPSHDMQATV